LQSSAFGDNASHAVNVNRPWGSDTNAVSERFSHQGASND